MASVPFSVELFQGLGAAEGLVRLDGDAIVVEYHTRDKVLGMLRSALRTHRVPLSLIDSVEFRRGWCGGRVRLRVDSMQALEGLAFYSPGILDLAIARKDREIAAALVGAVNERLGVEPPATLVSRERPGGSRLMNRLRREIPMDYAFVGGIAGVVALFAILATMSR